VSQGCQGLEPSRPADLGLLMQNTWPGLLVTYFLSVCLTQELFGRNGFEYMMFQLFKSPAKDLLFSDDTECLANLQDRTTYQKYLGPEYLQAIANVKHCLRSGE